MVRVLFVCHGNICRSPMAEYIFKEMVRKQHLEDCFYIESAGTSDEEVWRGIGNPIYPPAKKELDDHRIPYDDHRARQMTRKDYDRFDLLIAMEEMNLRNMRRICGGDPQGKMKLLLAYTDRGGNVADPWYSGDFKRAWKDIYEGCEGMLKSYTEK